MVATGSCSESTIGRHSWCGQAGVDAACVPTFKLDKI